MKSFLSFVFALIACLNNTFAQEKVYVELYCQSQYGGGERSFSVFTNDYDGFISKIKSGLTKSIEEKGVGDLVWDDIKISGLSDDVTILLRDGLLEASPDGKTSCWTPFSTQAYKIEKFENSAMNDSRCSYTYSIIKERVFLKMWTTRK